MAMSADHRNILREKRIELLKLIDPSVIFMSHFLKDNTLTEEMYAEIMEPPIYTRRERVAKLLDRLPARGALAFRRLAEALAGSEQEHVVEVIDPNNTLLAGDVPDSSKPPRPVKVNCDDDETNINSIMLQIGTRQKLTVLKCNDKQLERFEKSQRGEYDLGSPAGTVLIIAVTDGHDNKGLELDIEALQYVFKGLHFTPQVERVEKDNISDLERKLTDAAFAMKDTDKAFVLFILRCPNECKGTEIAKFFDGEKCVSLLNKPKLLFLQKQRETNSDSTARKVIEGAQADSVTSLKKSGLCIVTLHDTFNAAQHSEIVLCLAYTFAGFAAYISLTDMLNLVKSVVKKVREKEKRVGHELILSTDSTGFTLYFKP